MEEDIDGSPKHLNVYKPTFIINNSFAGRENQLPDSSYSKDDSIEHSIEKKYRMQ